MLRAGGEGREGIVNIKTSIWDSLFLIALHPTILFNNLTTEREIINFDTREFRLLFYSTNYPLPACLKKITINLSFFWREECSSVSVLCVIIHGLTKEDYFSAVAMIDNVGFLAKNLNFVYFRE